MASRLTEQVIGFIAAQTDMRKDKIGLTLSLQRDIGLDGDDAEEFIESFADRFDVDMTNFRFNRYFYTEGGGLLGILMFPFVNKLHSRRDLYVRDLINIAEQRKWYL